MSFRNVVWGAGTVAAVVMMLNYHTSSPPKTQAVGGAGQGAAQTPEPSEWPTLEPADPESPSDTSTSGGPTSGAPSPGTTSGVVPPLPSKSTSAPTTTKSRRTTTTRPTSTKPRRRTITGGVYQAGQWGPFQVKATFEGTKIVAITVTQRPTGGLSDQINQEAIPTLKAQALRTQSASGVDAISGATLSSNAFKRSLQSAIDQGRS